MANLERHFSVPEIAERWNMAGETVRRYFGDEPGVLRFGEGTRLVGRGKYKKRRFVLRIPESVLARVEERLMNKRAVNSVPLMGRRQRRDRQTG